MADMYILIGLGVIVLVVAVVLWSRRPYPTDPMTKYERAGTIPPMKTQRSTCVTCGRTIASLYDLDPELRAWRPQHWFLMDHGPADTSHEHEPTSQECLDVPQNDRNGES